ncbi:FtsK/SpoIIIE domain-containing protein [Micrococcus endophyticus]
MGWTVRILGGPTPETWRVNPLPQDPALRDRAVRERAPGRSLQAVASGPGSVTYAPRGGAEPAPGPELSVVTERGPDGGRLAPLTGGGVSVGRGRARLLLDDPAAPSRPTRLRLAAAGLHVEGAAEGAPRLWDGRRPHRIGRTTLGLMRGPQPPLPPPSVPAPPCVDLGSPPAGQSLAIPLLTAAAPLVIGVALVLVMRNPIFLLFGLLSVAVALTMLGLQRRARTRHAALLAERAAAVTAHRASAALSPGDVARAVRARTPDRFGLTGAAEGPATLSWGLGMGALGLSRDDPDQAWVAAVTARREALTVPSPAARTVVLGPPREAAGVCRWLVFQLLRHAVAADACLVVESGGSRRCWWAGGTGGAVLVTAPADVALEAAWAAWTAGIGGAPGERTGAQPARIDLTGADPAPGETVVDLRGGTLTDPGQEQRITGLEADGIAPATLAGWAAELADDVVDLGLLPADDGAGALFPPADVGTRDAVDALRVSLDAGPDGGPGALALDLAADGPHLLLAGTTGSGKSDLLLSLLLGVAAHHPPAEAAFLLLDFKGGASFGPLAALPHTMSLETNHVGAASLRALNAIRAELHRREALFAEAGVSDYPAFRRRHPEAALPRLVVAVDELRVLVDDHPDAAAVLQRLAATGRSLGFHLVLATQRATGAVGSDLRSNLGSTIALRTATEQESWDLVGTAAAARLDPRRPGSAILSTAGREPVPFRASRWAVDGGAPVWRRLGEAAEAPAAAPWEAVVAQLAERYAAGRWPTPPPVVTPALPERWVPDRTRRAGATALALLDDAAHGRHRPWRWAPGDEGRAAWIVEPAGGRAEALAAVLEVAVRGGAPVVVLDGTGEGAALPVPEGVQLIRPDEEDAGERAAACLRELAAAGGTAVLTGWTAWAGRRLGESYRTLEEDTQGWLGEREAAGLRVAAFGGRELATSRLLLHLPHRFYVPAGTSAEHRLVWPRLVEVEPLPGRAVHVSPDVPEPGLPCQLASPGAHRSGAVDAASTL